jgi:hypothetical protein
VAATRPPHTAPLVAEPRVVGIEGAWRSSRGVMAGSIALIAFGLDSAIEGVASIVIVLAVLGLTHVLAACRAASPVLGGAPVLHARPVHRLREALGKLVSGGEVVAGPD